MRIYLREISENETVLDFHTGRTDLTGQTPSTECDWLKAAVTSCDENLSPLESEREQAVLRTARPREIEAHFGIRKVDDVIVVSGNVKSSVRLICSRCANPFSLAVEPRFSALYCKDPVMAGIAHLAKSKNDPIARPVGQNHGRARHAHDTSGDDDQSVNTEITYIQEDFIDLADVVIEQIQIKLPFQPLCQENCKGVCQTCGADLNVGRCACSKILKQNPFSVLQGFKARH